MIRKMRKLVLPRNQEDIPKNMLAVHSVPTFLPYSGKIPNACDWRWYKKTFKRQLMIVSPPKRPVMIEKIRAIFVWKRINGHFAYSLDVAMVNSSILYRRIRQQDRNYDDPMKLSNFRVEVADVLCKDQQKNSRTAINIRPIYCNQSKNNVIIHRQLIFRF